MPVTIDEINAQVTKANEAIAAMQAKNDEKIAELEKKGSFDPLQDETIKKMQDEIDKKTAVVEGYRKEIDDLKTITSRTPRGNGEGKSIEVPSHFKSAVERYLRKGDEAGLEKAMEQLTPDEKKALSVGVDSDGGYRVVPEMSARITQKVFETSPIRQIAAVQSIGTDSLDYHIDVNEADAGWVAETQARPETGTPKIGKGNIPTHEMYAQPKATQKLLDDASVDMDAWLTEKVRNKFSRVENTSFVLGDGVGKPRGFITLPDGLNYNQIEQVISGGATTITTDGLINLIYALKDEYARNASFVMKRSSVRDVRLLKNLDGDYIWKSGLDSGKPDTLLTHQIVQADDMPEIAAGTLPVAFGDFREGYQIVDRQGVSLLRDPYTDKPFVKFYMTRRVGGDVVNGEALKLMRIGAS